MNMTVKQALGRFGISTEKAATVLSQMGYGNADELRAALENNDSSKLGFARDAGSKLSNNTGMLSYVRSMLGGN